MNGHSFSSQQGQFRVMSGPPPKNANWRRYLIFGMVRLRHPSYDMAHRGSLLPLIAIERDERAQASQVTGQLSA